MAKLNQIIAVLNGKKTQTYDHLTKTHHILQKDALFSGIARTYRPLEENGETYPEEKKYHQFSVRELLAESRTALSDLFDVTATQEYANTGAKANVVVDGKTILENVPVTYLLFLEKQLVDLGTLLSKLPTLDPAEKWHWDETTASFTSEPAVTHKTKKVPRSHILYEATTEHPAQVEMYHEDLRVGDWTATKSSGAIPKDEQKDLVERVRKLRVAVKFAREEANNIAVEDQEVAKNIFDYVFGA